MSLGLTLRFIPFPSSSNIEFQTELLETSQVRSFVISVIIAWHWSGTMILFVSIAGLAFFSYVFVPVVVVFVSWLVILESGDILGWCITTRQSTMASANQESLIVLLCRCPQGYGRSYVPARAQQSAHVHL